MAISVSPSVLVRETDLTNTIPAISTSIGASVGDFEWGPANEITLISSENELYSVFGKPSAQNYKDWFSCADFLSYSSALKVIRASATGSLNASATGTGAASAGVLVRNHTEWSTVTVTDFIVAKYPGAKGNDIRVVVCDDTNFATRTFNISTNGVSSTQNVKDYFSIPNADAGEMYWLVILNDSTTNTDTVVETFITSKTVGAKNLSGEVYYADSLINTKSKYIWVKYSNISNTDAAPADGVLDIFASDIQLGGGSDGAITDGDKQSAYDIFVNTPEEDINLLFVGGASSAVAKYALQNVADVRKDCIVFISPQETDVVGHLDPAAIISQKSLDNYPSSSYGVYDGNYKLRYDKYHDVYRWVPLNGDVAGLCARTDDIADPWFSPAGLNRGNLKNVVKLAYNPSKAMRDELYKNNINPITTFQGEGAVLYGDKTMQTKPSAFDRINVRRLFIILEKSISTAAKYLLFEQNDPQTRAVFRNMVEPFLRRVQGRRGIAKFRVVADETNNTAEVISQNSFVGDIYIVPIYSINVIQLNFNAVRGDVSFEEIVG